MALGISLALAAVLAAAALTANLGLAPPPAGPSASVIVIGRSPLLDRPAPEIDLVDLDGRHVRLRDFRGRPLVVNFWASYCDPCRTEFPLYREARKRHAAEGLEILGLVHDDSASAARTFVSEQRAEWPQLLDAGDVAWRAYGAQGLPTSYFVDRGGSIRAISYGPPPSGVLDEQLNKIL